MSPVLSLYRHIMEDTMVLGPSARLALPPREERSNQASPATRAF